MLKNSGFDNFSIDIYGDGDLEMYVDIAKSLQVSNLVSFYGPKSHNELIQLYISYDAFLFPTWEREPFGFAPIEAAALGCIPIITSTCGVAERLIHNVNCLKIKRVPDSLFNAMKLFCMGQVDFQAVGKNAIAITREDLSFDSCINSINQVLESLTSKERNRSPISWRDFNLAHLKHNFAKDVFLQGQS
jgi:glycosyltransferase involved in cell wall biosynthesis